MRVVNLRMFCEGSATDPQHRFVSLGGVCIRWTYSDKRPNQGSTGLCLTCKEAPKVCKAEQGKSVALNCKRNRIAIRVLPMWNVNRTELVTPTYGTIRERHPRPIGSHLKGYLRRDCHLSTPPLTSPCALSELHCRRY